MSNFIFWKDCFICSRNVQKLKKSASRCQSPQVRLGLDTIWQRDANFRFSMTFKFNIFLCFSTIRNHLSNFSYLVCVSCKIFIRWRFYLFLKTENSRRVVESRSVLSNSVNSRQFGQFALSNSVNSRCRIAFESRSVYGNSRVNNISERQVCQWWMTRRLPLDDKENSAIIGKIQITRTWYGNILRHWLSSLTSYMTTLQSGVFIGKVRWPQNDISSKLFSSRLVLESS
jgi:hypothetical protein